MKKFITLICLMLTMIFVFAGCSCNNDKKDWKVAYVAGTVSSNGGFATQVGDYVYFINGLEDSKADNSWGGVVKGSLSRIAVSDLAEPEDKSIVVVPQIFASTYYETGLCIFGDYVYYATPSTKTNKKGEVQNNVLSFHKTKLDGTDTSDPILEVEDNFGIEYKYIQNGESVYLVTITKNADDENKKVISVYDMGGGKIFSYEEADSYVIADEYDSKYIFFTDLDKDSDENDEQYGILYAYELGKNKESIVVKARPESTLAGAPFGTLGYTFTLERNAFGRLFLTVVPADTNNGEKAYYAYVDIANLTMVEEDADLSTSVANFGEIVSLNIPGLSSIINKTNRFISKDEVVFMDSKAGIVKFDIRNIANEYMGKSTLATLANMKVGAGSIVAIEGGYAYYLAGAADSSSSATNYLWRVAIDETPADNVGEQITSIAIDADWYDVEVFGDYVLCMLDSDPLSSYVYSLEADVNAKIAREKGLTVGEDDAEIKTFVDEYFDGMKSLSSKDNEELFEQLVSRRIGKIKGSDNDKVNSFASSNYTTSSSSSK